MKITPFFPIATTNSAQRTRRTSSNGSVSFSDYLSGSDESSDVAEARPAPPASALSGILAVQEVSDEEVKRQKAYKQAHLTLDALEELRNALLLGAVPAHLLTRIAQRIADQKQEVTDPRLLSLIKDVELRAAVELAKLEASR
jgi:hypothetical protein